MFKPAFFTLTISDDIDQNPVVNGEFPNYETLVRRTMDRATFLRMRYDPHQNAMIITTADDAQITVEDGVITIRGNAT